MEKRKRKFSLWRALLLAAAAAALGTPAGAAIVKVQQQSVAPTSVSGSTPITGTFGSNTAAGNWYAVLVRAGFQTGWGMNVTDSEGNTWSNCGATNGGNLTHQLEIFYAQNVVGGTHDAISVNTTGNGANSSTMSLVMFEYSGIATASSLDACNGTGGTGSTSPLTSSSVTTTNANDLIVGGFGEGSDTTWTAGSGYAIENSTTRVAFETQVVSATGSYQPQISVGTTGTSWTAITAAFKAAAGGGGGGPTPCFGCLGVGSATLLGNADIQLSGALLAAPLDYKLSGAVEIPLASLAAYPGCDAAQNCSAGLHICQGGTTTKCIDVYAGNDVPLDVSLIRKVGSAARELYPMGTVKLTFAPALAEWNF